MNEFPGDARAGEGPLPVVQDGHPRLHGGVPMQREADVRPDDADATGRWYRAMKGARVVARASSLAITARAVADWLRDHGGGISPEARKLVRSRLRSAALTLQDAAARLP